MVNTANQAATPLVLLPGSLCDERLFVPQLAYFSPDRQTQVIDLRGYNSISAMAEAVLDQAPPIFALAGLSMGGIVALQIMQHAPQRVSALALLNTNANPATKTQYDLREQQIKAVKKVGEQAAMDIADSMIDRYFAKQHPDHATLRAIAHDMALQAGADSFIKQSQAINSRLDLRPVLAKINCPCLVLCGAEDQICPPHLHQQIADSISHATLSIIEGCGHLSTLEAPDEVNQALEKLLHDIEHHD